MADYGVTSAGFIRKPFNEIETDNEAKAKEFFGSDTDLSVYSPIGLFVRMLSWKENVLWQQLENAYYANWLATAEGINLDRLVEWGGITRKQDQHAIIKDVIFTGTDGTNIPAGTVIETAQGVQFATNESVTIESGSGIVNCTAVKTGTEGNVDAGTVNFMVNPVSGVNVTNPQPGEGGTVTETDAELRARYKIEGAEGVGSNPEAIRNAVSRVEGVLSVSVYENVTLGEDPVTGRPAKSVECIVNSDEAHDNEIAEAIFKTKSAGIESYGEVMVPYLNKGDGKTYNIWFNRPLWLNVYADLDITYNGETALPEDIIRNNTINYIKDVGSGEVIYPWRISAVNKDIEGIVNMVVTITTKGYQEISSFPGKFTASNLCSLNEGTYTLNVAVDGSAAALVSIAIEAGLTWAGVITAMQAAVDAAGCQADAEIAFSRIRITSRSHGTSSGIIITDGTTNGFIAAVNALSGMDPVILAAVNGKSIGAGEGLSVGFRELPFCESGFITIT